MRTYLTKNHLALQLSLLRRSHPKSARTSPRECTQNAPDFIQIGSLSAELFHNASTPSQRALESESNIRLKPSFEPNKTPYNLKILYTTVVRLGCYVLVFRSGSTSLPKSIARSSVLGDMSIFANCKRIYHTSCYYTPATSHKPF